MKQVLRKGFKEITVDEVPDPAVMPQHVLVRPLFSLVSSGTETASIHQGNVLKEAAENPSQLQKVWDAVQATDPARAFAEVRAKFSEYAVMGYSGAGVVAAKHPGVTDLEVGDRVAYGGEGTGHAETVLAGRQLTVRVPDAVRIQDACFATLGSIAMNAVRIANIGLGESVAVIGLGLVGQLVCQLATAQGARVIGIDLRPERVELAGKLGAEHGLEAGDGLLPAVRALTGGRGADCVVIAAAAKSDIPCRQGLEICRDRGRLVVVGAVDLSFPWLEMYLKEIQLFMSRAYGPGSYDPSYEREGQDYPLSYVRWTENRNMQEFLRLVGAGRVRVAPLVTHEFPVEEAAAAYRTILAPGSASLAVLLRYPAADSANPAAEFLPQHRVDVAPRPAKAGLGVALAGAGNLARWAHLPALKKIPGVSLRAIHSSSGARGKSYARRFQAEYCSTDYGQILEDPDIDVVVIVSRNQHHAAQAEAALRAGKHVFVEKPMALTEEECRSLWRAVRDSGKLLTVGFNRRFAPFYLDQKRALAGRAGPAVVACRVNSPGISGSYWMADPAIGGAILGEACHFVDLMYWLLESEPVAVSAYSLPLDSAEPVGLNNLAASFRFADGSVGSLTYCTVGSKTSGGERVEVFQQGLGVVSEDFKRLSVRRGLRRNRARWFAEKGYNAQMESFLSAIRQGAQPQVTVRDGVRATVGCLRMLDAARTASPCPIALDSILD
jgi:predicted dehydrogenase/threonine dehydrogenase-like Zn-dependent dehydrogenase